MSKYWFWGWLEKHRVSDLRSLHRVLHRPGAVDALLALAPEKVMFSRPDAPDFAELTGGKGIDLTGELGCRHINCLRKELDGLFRHAWHYFDQISLPDQALGRLVDFERHENVDTLCGALESFVLVLHRLKKIGGLELVRFDVRRPSCTEHFEGHAEEANIKQAFVNVPALADELARTAEISHKEGISDGHRHVDYRLDSDWFEHSEWGTLCSQRDSIPTEPRGLRLAVAVATVRKYLAAISADAFAARQARSPLGATVPLYRRLLVARPTPTIGDVAFDLALPVNNDASVEALIRLRQDERDAFSRFQFALRTAIAERLKLASALTADVVAREVVRDVVEPELRNIREKLKLSRRFALRGAGVGLALGGAAVSVGLLSPLALHPAGASLAIAGAVTLAGQSLKKAHDDELAVLREVKLSDMYFLWRGHRH